MEYTQGKWANIGHYGNLMSEIAVPGLAICTVWTRKECDATKNTLKKKYEDDPEGIANAHLISAAPDMYEALKSVLSSVVCNGDWSISYAIDRDIRLQINAALAKAEGK